MRAILCANEILRQKRAGLITNEELDILDNIHDPYSRYWTPIQWCYNLLYEAKEEKKIASDHLLEKITDVSPHDDSCFRSTRLLGDTTFPTRPFVPAEVRLGENPRIITRMT